MDLIQPAAQWYGARDCTEPLLRTSRHMERHARRHAAVTWSGAATTRQRQSAEASRMRHVAVTRRRAVTALERRLGS
jgi:hypothetical protein